MFRPGLSTVLATLVLAATVAACRATPAPSPAAPTASPVAAADGPAAAPAFELVESVPVETTLDHPGLRDAADVWPEMIAAARTSIDLGEFYASNQQSSRLEPVVQALEAAVARGVRVRFLAEKIFVKIYPETLERLARAGITVRHLDLSASHGSLHAKYFIVDGRDAFLGSQNFDWRSLEHNYEIGARIRDSGLVGGLAAIFAADWARAGGEPAPEIHAPPGHGAIRLVASPRDLLPPGIPWELPGIIELLDGARETITVQALDYHAGAGGTRWDELEAPLLRAAARGVHVELLMADWSKRPQFIPDLQRLVRVPNVAVRLTTIPAWSGGFVPFARVTHAKALVVDGKRGWLGTSNWGRDYFYTRRNIGVLIDDPAIAAQLAGFFATLWESSYAVPVDPDARYAPPRIE